MAFSLRPNDEMWRAVCLAPLDDMPKLIFADYIQEYGYISWANVIRSDINGVVIPESENHQFWIDTFGQSWLENFPADMFPFLRWQKGFPSIIDLSYNQRQALIFQNAYVNMFNDDIVPSSAATYRSIILNRRHASRYLRTLPDLLPITDILMSPFHIYCANKVATIYIRERDETWVYHYGARGRTLLGWFQALGMEMRQPYRGGLDYQDLLRGHGNLWLAQCARAVTVRNRRRRSPDDRLMAYPIQGHPEFDQGHDGIAIRGLQQYVRPVPDQQTLQHVDVLQGLSDPAEV